MKKSVEIESALDRLKARSLRQTPFRKALLRYMLAENRPLNFQQIFDGMKHQRKFGKRVADRATLFRNLRTLTEKEVLEQTEFGTGASHYYLKSTGHRHHVYCLNCHRVEALKICAIQPMVDLARRKGFQIQSHRVELFGFCSNCA